MLLNIVGFAMQARACQKCPIFPVFVPPGASHDRYRIRHDDRFGTRCQGVRGIAFALILTASCSGETRSYRKMFFRREDFEGVSVEMAISSEINCRATSICSSFRVNFT